MTCVCNEQQSCNEQTKAKRGHTHFLNRWSMEYFPLVVPTYGKVSIYLQFILLPHLHCMYAQFTWECMHFQWGVKAAPRHLWKELISREKQKDQVLKCYMPNPSLLNITCRGRVGRLLDTLGRLPLRPKMVGLANFGLKCVGTLRRVKMRSDVNWTVPNPITDRWLHSCYTIKVALDNGILCYDEGIAAKCKVLCCVDCVYCTCVDMLGFLCCWQHDNRESCTMVMVRKERLA